MIVKDLIKALEQMPSEASVGYIWDGALRSDARFVWLARSGDVAISDGGVVYNTSDRPESAPTSSRNQYWEPKP